MKSRQFNFLAQTATKTQDTKSVCLPFWNLESLLNANSTISFFL